MDKAEIVTLSGDSPYERNTLNEEIGEAVTCSICMPTIEMGMQGMSSSPGITKLTQTLVAAQSHNTHQTHKRKIHINEVQNKK